MRTTLWAVAAALIVAQPACKTPEKNNMKGPPAQADAPGPGSGAPPAAADPTASKAKPGPTAEDAKAFAARVNKDLKELWVHQARTDWVKNTYITYDTELLSAKATEQVLEYTANAIKEAAQFRGLPLDPDTERTLTLLKVSSPLVAPSDAAKRAELAGIAAKMDAIYGAGKYCKTVPGKGGSEPKQDCKDLGELSKILAEKRDYAQLLDAWQGWRTVSPQMRPMYERFVSLANDGAKEIGYEDTGKLWRSAYDMPPEAFEAETERLWGQVKPLYDQLQCYVRERLAKTYGADKVPANGPIPAHLLGNMWAQEWGNVYDLVEPYKGEASIDVTKALRAKSYDDKKMVKLAEGFFTSIGLDALPTTFWERSLFTKPKDREVVCHASAWDVEFNNDLRIKMCIKIDEEDLITIHHELGHDYYFMYYHTLPALYQAGANDGFHEAIGDAIALSVTPGYLKKVGILEKVASNDKWLINLQMKDALEKVAFLPFGLLIDKWRWDVFSGKIPPSKYNEAWWALVKQYQGVAPPMARGEQDFDPGAKYHIPANVPYTRYFLARILQFQFHRAMCKAAGFNGPLHECSIHGNKDAGAKLRAMLAMGASKPWPDALEAATGERQMDASALLDYFAPLRSWLEKQNAGKQCGWQ